MAIAKNSLFIEPGVGKGEPLVFIHGLGGSSNSWYPQRQVLNRDYRLSLYDLAGSGRSPVVEDVSIQSHVEDLAEVAKWASEDAPVHIAAHSMGSIIAQHYAAQNPDRVRSLTLIGGFPAPPEGARTALRARAQTVRDGGMIAIADAIVAGGTSTDTKSNNPAAAAFVRESIMAQQAEGYARNCEALANAKSAEVSKITCPVLLITGNEDKTASPDVARALASQLANAQVTILPGCGHWATVERGKQVNYAMTLFYARLRKAQGDS